MQICYAENFIIIADIVESYTLVLYHLSGLNLPEISTRNLCFHKLLYKDSQHCSITQFLNSIYESTL